jgi:hypothetical protein
VTSVYHCYQSETGAAGFGDEQEWQMTSLTMYDSWTAPTMLSLWTEPESRRTKTVHRVSSWVGTIDTAVRVLSPVVVSGGVMFAALMWPAPADADPLFPAPTVPGTVAATNAGPIKTAVAEFGQSLCPMLVKPGSNLATNASQLQGNSGLTNTIAGAATGMAIQMECPALMSQLANGNLSSLSALLQLMGGKSTPAPGLKLPGLDAATPNPVQVPAF